MQRQSVEIELNEVTTALTEVKSSTGDIYRVVSSIMMKVQKDKVLHDLEQKKQVLTLRFQTLDKQQKLLEEKAQGLREELNSAMSSSSKN